MSKGNWELPEKEMTPETVFWTRRNLFKTIGFSTGSFSITPTWLQGAERDFRTKKNPKYLNPFGGLTDEKIVTHYNNFYEFSIDKKEVSELVESWKTPPGTLEVKGMVHRPKIFDAEELGTLFGMEQRIYRFRCVEAWSMVVPWDGFSLSKLLDRVQPLSSAKYVKFISFLDPVSAPGQRNSYYPWPYVEGLRLDEAMNELSMLVGGVFGKPLPKQNGAPWRLIVPWKYGFKSIKSIVKIELTDQMPSSLWMDLAPKEYGFYANVNPYVDHPRWSQKRERPLGKSWFTKINTLMFNGYAEQVASLYKGLDLKKFY